MVAQKVKGVIGSLIGIGSIIWGILVNLPGADIHASIESYGGDAYTGIQNAIVIASIHIEALEEILKWGLCGILVIIGAVILLNSIFLIIKKPENNTEPKNTQE